MKKHIRNICTALLAGILIATTVMTDNMIIYSNADTISDAEARRQQLQNKKQRLQDELSELENDKKDVIAYIEKVDKKIGNLTRDMLELKEHIKENKKEIKSLNKQIEQTQNDINNQYDTMKRRIKYMYENGKTQYIDIVLSSGSISDILSRTEYIQKISDYDKNMLNNYIASKEELERQKIVLDDVKDKLDVAMQELKAEKNALSEMSRKKNDELEAFNQSISNTQSEISQNDNELDRQEKIIADALLEQQRRIMEEERQKEEARKAQEAKKTEEVKKAQEEKQGEETSEKVTATKKPAATATPAASTSTSAGGFRWPLNSAGKITSYFGNRNSPTAGASSYHQGIDIGIAGGTPIVAAKSGTVVSASYSAAAGNYVMINHGDGIFTVYMHASSLAVSVGQEVSQGEVIAYVGSTGVSTGNHLHFGVSVGGTYVNPLNYVSQ